MNEKHLTLCGSAEWADAVRRWIVPWVLDGMGRTTDVLREHTQALTAVDLDPVLAGQLTDRLAGTNVTVVCADAAATGLDGDRFSGAVCLTMLHHVPSPTQQDAIFAEAFRVLSPGGIFVGTDSLDGPDFRELHVGDICVPIAPHEYAPRLAATGFRDVEVVTNDYAVRFQAHKPPAAT
jgi:SAM-dependent methyltransferase